MFLWISCVQGVRIYLFYSISVCVVFIHDNRRRNQHLTYRKDSFGRDINGDRDQT